MRWICIVLATLFKYIISMDVSFFTFYSYYAMIAWGCHYKVPPFRKQVIFLFLMTKSHIESTKLLDAYVWMCVCIVKSNVNMEKAVDCGGKNEKPPNRFRCFSFLRSFSLPFLFITLFFASVPRAHAYARTYKQTQPKKSVPCHQYRFFVQLCVYMPEYASIINK